MNLMNLVNKIILFTLDLLRNYIFSSKANCARGLFYCIAYVCVCEANESILSLDFSQGSESAECYDLEEFAFSETIAVDSYGEQEADEKVRVSFIDCTTYEMMNQSLQFISESHGNVKVHFVFRPTNGWLFDSLQSIAAKINFFNRMLCLDHGFLLAEMWRNLIEEMGGVDGGGTIIHYAYGLGGIETVYARELLSPEEQKMIRVVTLGSSALISNQGFESVVNHAIYSPIAYIRNYFNSNMNVQFYGSAFNVYWQSDHLLDGSIYGPVLCKLGQEFIETYHIPSNTNKNSEGELESTLVGCYGSREVGQKVSITFINGILNDWKTMHESLSFISKSHGDVKINYIFRSTEGVVWDLANSLRIKTTFNLGYHSYQACILAEMWKKLIQEMGGIGNGGIIIHYAHSLGGTDTDRARALLSPEEQKMIRVITFGSATMIRNHGFQSVVNYVNINDIVSYTLFVDPHGHVRNYFDPNTNIRFHGNRNYSHFLSWDGHALLGPSYRELLLDLGEQFIQEFF